MTDGVEQRGWLAAGVVGLGATLVHRARGLIWSLRRAEITGVRGIPVTPDGRIVLIRHTYLPGWHFPGGGYGRGEDPQAAMLRELREEIGMTGHGAVARFADYEQRGTRWRDSIAFFVVRDVEFVPRLSLEIAAIGSFPPDALPAGLSFATRRRIAEWCGEASVSPDW